MSSQLFIQNLYLKCKTHGTGGAQVAISDAELHALISLSLHYLEWEHSILGIPAISMPDSDYFQISLDWFESANYSESIVQESNLLSSALHLCPATGLPIGNIQSVKQK